MLETIPINPELKDRILTHIQSLSPDQEVQKTPPETAPPMDHEKKSPSRGSHEADFGPLLVDKYLDAYGIGFFTKRSPRGDATLYCLDHCIFDPSHRGNDSAIIQDDSGKLRYQCFHASCHGRTWAEAREIISGQDKLTKFLRDYDPDKARRRRSPRPAPLSEQAGDDEPSIRLNGSINRRLLMNYLKYKLDPIIYDGHEFLRYDDQRGVWRVCPVHVIRRIAGQSMDLSSKMEHTNDAVKQLEADCFVDPDDFLPDPEYINVRNGMVNINTLEVVHHDPKYNSQVQFDVNYDRKAENGRWIQFINEVFPGDRDKQVVLQQYLGYCLLPHCRLQRCLFLIGSGANGKSVITEIMVSIIGQNNVCRLSLDQMNQRFMIGFLKNKQVNLAGEVSAASPVDTATFKDVVAGGLIMADRKNGQPFTFHPIAKHIFSMNEMPRVNDKSYGFARRPIILTFTEQFIGEKADPNLIDTLESIKDGIFAWMMNGLDFINKTNTIVIPDGVQLDSEELIKATNPLMYFVEECCITTGRPDPQLAERPQDLYKAYRQWCEESGNRPLAKHKFYQQLEISCGAQRKQLGADRERFFVGIKLRQGCIGDTTDTIDTTPPEKTSEPEVSEPPDDDVFFPDDGAPF